MFKRWLSMKELLILLITSIVVFSGCVEIQTEDFTTSETPSFEPNSSTKETYSTSSSVGEPSSSLESKTSAENGVMVTFVVEVPDYTPEGDSIYIAGDFNGWNPGDENYKLKRRADGKWEITLSFQKGRKIEFKFTRGSWETVEKGKNGEEIPNRVLVIEKEGTYEFKVYHWRDYVEETGVGTHTIVGNIITFKMKIPQLDNRERRIWVYLPPDYNQSNRRYPVLYMHDGQNLFDQATSFAGEWQVDETLERLFKEKGFAIIVVGIDNGGERRIDEYSPWVNSEYGRGGEGDAYVRFIVETLKPYIDSKYRTLPNETGIMGSSLGGLISIYAGFKYPEVFKYVGAMSSAFWFNPEIYEFV